ncbi:MAG TPA: hypothetical protein VHC71_03200 [Hyphomicrobium sp.]|jgi:hypothetical protein|nr:hypothetical protein [Hyphomicrobium sp.]
MVPLSRIRLELARNPDFPEGSTVHGYDIIAPLDSQGKLNERAWKKLHQLCRVQRFWKGEEDKVGRLARKPGGVWFVDYDPKTDADDEPGFRFGSHVFRSGEYVSIRENDGVPRTFRVVSVVDYAA